MPFTDAFLGNIGAFFTTRNAFPAVAVTAGGSGDNTAINSTTITRSTLSANTLRSAKFVVSITAVLAATKTATVTLKVQHNDGSGWTDYTYRPTGGTLGTVTKVLTGQTGGSTEVGTLELDVDLSGAHDQIRAVVTPDLNASGTDTATVTGLWCFATDVFPAAL